MELIKKLININYTKGTVIKPEYIVIHETDNFRAGADAMAHYNYWSSDPNAQSSVHFVCDDKCVVQLGEFEIGKCWRMWHVGDNKGYSNITNSNTIGIEICVNLDGNYDKARANAVELVRYIMPIVGLSPDRVVRHKDASGKSCPNKMIANPALWEEFKKQIDMQVKPANTDPSVVVAENYTAALVNPLLLRIAVIDSASKSQSSFVNGGYFGLQGDGKTYSTGMLYDGKNLSNVATHKLPVGTLLVYKNGRTVIVPIDDIAPHNQYNDLQFAVSGMSILPYRQNEEGFTGTFADVARLAPRSMLGYNSKNGLVYAICHKNITAQDGGKLMQQLGCDSAITLDGGGSTCMRVYGRDIMTSSRRIHNVVCW